jgi:hypothetical protein
MKSYKTFKDDICIQMTHEEAISLCKEALARDIGVKMKEVISVIKNQYLLNDIDIDKEIHDSLMPEGLFTLDNNKK